MFCIWTSKCFHSFHGFVHADNIGSAPFMSSPKSGGEKPIRMNTWGTDSGLAGVKIRVSKCLVLCVWFCVRVRVHVACARVRVCVLACVCVHREFREFMRILTTFLGKTHRNPS